MLSGVPYPPRFDLPAQWSDSTYKLSWRVNCSTDVISYDLEFREAPLGRWVSITVPGDAGLNGGTGTAAVTEHVQSYTLQGLERAATYEVTLVVQMCVELIIMCRTHQYGSNLS